ncbi:hypothetical protein BBB52_03750 [Aggregatibacter aphrophilus]|uniref:Uncharacterized protein n=1 Tax=Aggregatibacter aphrophilus TaxID=732 RepID=A0AAP7GZ29_AGGAP|nr:hypothetical protein BBB52_03750 [Aggregatibacter aphrophilus]
MRIGQLAQLNEVAYGSDFLYTTSELYGFFYLKFRGKHRKTLKKKTIFKTEQAVEQTVYRTKNMLNRALYSISIALHSAHDRKYYLKSTLCCIVLWRCYTVLRIPSLFLFKFHQRLDL